MEGRNVFTHLSECLGIHSSSCPVKIQHLGPLLISWLWLAGSSRASSPNKRSMAISLGSLSTPWDILATSTLQSLTQDTSPKKYRDCAVRFCVWCSNSFMSVWKLQKLEKSWTWTLSWALRHKWLIRGCLLAAQAWRVSVSHSDCYFQTVTANNKSATLEVNQWEWRQSSVIPTYLLIVIVKLLPDLTMVSWASWNVRVSINVTRGWGVSSPCVCRFGHPLHWQPTRGPRQPGQQSRRWRCCWPKKKTIYRTSIH